MDGLGDPGLEAVFPYTTPDDGDDDGAAEPQAEDADYWRKKFEEHHREAERKITDQSEQISATNQMLQNLIQMQSEALNRPAAPAHQPASSGNPIVDHLTGLASGNGQKQADTANFLTREQAEQLAAQRANDVINQRLTQAEQYKQTMNAVYSRFVSEEPELQQYGDLAATLFHAAPGDVNQKYHAAIGKLKGMIVNGTLPAPARAGNGKRPNGTPSGGQQMNGPWTSPRNQSQDDRPKVPTMADMQHELAEWTRQRRENQIAKMEIRPARKVSKLDFTSS